MKNNLFKSALAAAAATALFAQAAQAQTIGYNNGDLILGVEESGATNDYEVDLGNINLFTAGNNINFSSIVLNSDLSSSSGFGSGYATSANVFFSVVGTNFADNQDINNSTYGKLFKKAVYLTATTVPAAQTGNQLGGGGTAGQIASASTTIGSQTPTTTNGKAAFISASGLTSYTTEENTTPGEEFSQPTTDQLSMLAASQGGVLDLYILNPGSDTNGNAAGTEDFLGDFSFENGDLKFNSATATPEPSTYALLILSMGALVWLVRRRSVNS